ncbi:MAG: 16S rRNA (cytidine(1402)-2'-O)-methyltransferase [Candidatus Cloacimonadaceae bacterium]|nr:16S rRNA (cytidine(1402)-2'-O)-methyltransferase [Candidatus Cloacimonadaceae bacterium]
MKSGKLYLVPTPIGNLGDMTLRGLETLKSATLIAAEDTRSARRLLKHFQIPCPALISYHKFSEKRRIPEIMAILEQGKDVAIISDAGSPGISDPAEIIVKAAIDEGVEVIALPGATAFVPALTASGLPCSSFLFLGFLPQKPKDRKQIMQRIVVSPDTVILYEAPHRVKKTLMELYKHLGKRQIVIARELSKIYEEYIRTDLGSLLEDYQVMEKGEFVILIEPCLKETVPDPGQLRYLVKDMLRSGKQASAILEELSSEYPRNQVYQIILSFKKPK